MTATQSFSRNLERCAVCKTFRRSVYLHDKMTIWDKTAKTPRFMVQVSWFIIRHRDIIVTVFGHYLHIDKYRVIRKEGQKVEPC